MEPTFRLPDAAAAIPKADRAAKMRANADLCLLDDGRQFLRCVLPVPVEGRDTPLNWGVWVEVDAEVMERVQALWRSDDQAKSKPFAATLANQIPGYANTLGLPLQMQLTGPETRPSVTFTDATAHPFAEESRAGVTEHEVAEWMKPFLRNG